MNPVMASMAAQQITSQVFLGEKYLHCGYRSPLHWHDYIEAEIVLFGRVSHWYNGTRRVLHRGDAYVMTPNDFHALCAETETRMLGVMLAPEQLSPKLTQAVERGTCCGTLNESDLAWGMQCAERVRCWAPGSPYAAMNARYMAESVLMTVLQSGAVQPDGNGALLHQVLQILNASFRTPLTLRDVAKRLAVSPNYLGYQIKRQSGRTFHQHLNRIRLRYACHLLRASELSVKEIAFSSGYASVEYFASVFRQEIHMSPSAYRETNA